MPKMRSIFEQSDLPSVDHFVVAFYFAFGIFAARFFLDSFVFRRLSIWLLCGGTSLAKIDDAARAKATKCAESMWKFTYFATIEVVTLASIYNEPFFRDTNELSRNWPNHNLKLSLKLIYMCQCGFYIYSIIALITWETRRKDFSVSISHHVITLILIAGSYVLRIFRVGTMLLALHDASDVFLEAAKVFKYSEREFEASLFFGFFALSWLLLRLVYFPFWIIRQTGYQSIKVVNMAEPFYQKMYYGFNTMLLTLLVFHIYWWKLICAMIVKQMNNQGKVSEDVRSDSEDDE
ncbi:ceramide synthase LOH2-like isoform X2 [Andrographis paniculata]|uniref:ceramide synthase LOH2-like isoform X2 n=1 Tax=Andrographis paniculata TaxID=175694 RepID=UPI0021E73D6E|nr:ceramide synthase LOH2-like isoform X2 [Andrographis paniculata]